MDSSVITWEVGAILAAIVSFVSIITNVVFIQAQSKKQRTAEIITNNRVEWMQELKKWTSEYISYIESDYDKISSEDIDKYLKDTIEISTRINLHLNLKGKQDKEIMNVIEEINLSFEKKPQPTKDKESIYYDEIKRATHLLQLLVKIYLKIEWERVKVEAENGKFSSFNFDKIGRAHV